MVLCRLAAQWDDGVLPAEERVAPASEMSERVNSASDRFNHWVYGLGEPARECAGKRPRGARLQESKILPRTHWQQPVRDLAI